MDIETVKNEVFGFPHRQIHFVGGDNSKMIGKIPSLCNESGVDCLLLNLEDAVAVANKKAAREGAVQALLEQDFGNSLVWSRINGLETEWYEDDIRAIVEASSKGHRLDVILIPKVQSAQDIKKVEDHLNVLEDEFKIDRPILIAALLETAKGVANIQAIAGASKRMHSMHFGPADLAADLGVKVLDVGGAHHDSLVMVGDKKSSITVVDLWNPYIMALVVACRSNGILPIYGPYGRLLEEDSSEIQFKSMYVRGCVGAWTLHPKQIAAAGRAFAPSSEELSKACTTMIDMAAAEKSGAGAVMRADGVMLDEAVVKQALNFVGNAIQIMEKDAALAKQYEKIKTLEEAIAIFNARK